MIKLKPYIKKQYFLYLLCIILGFALYPLNARIINAIKLSLRSEKDIVYSKNPVTFALDYLYAWEDNDKKKHCNMTNQNKDLCDLTMSIKHLRIKDTKLVSENKEKAVVYIEFDGKSSLSGENENYFWNFDLSWNQKNNRWAIEGYGY